MKTFIPALVLFGLAATVASCSRDDKFIGTWTSVSPENITDQVPAAATASSLPTIQFIQGAEQGKGGPVALSTIIDVTQPVNPAPGDMSQAYEVNVAATSSITGRWSYEDGDDRRLLLSFDLSSLKVNVDRNGVTFTQNMLTGAQQPQLDSLTDATADLWRMQLTAAMKAQLSRYTELDDVTVSRDNILSFTIHSPEYKMHFRQVD